ncbi:uncharacterized protein MYCGRDRAFT_91921 [Zymoseptoria tritici IPO323]|uniref:Uncharacterized protein n=1 Tax=Zymoseptoria tritici (strain CBS 115943 / IPO323) TaxID=336722 RepID=F9X7W4_ZYMTI|nr:uncharacterized protein MYCGRDRAFT_91921 [Zymoseptoria tritici IPO323]EGP88946.1 hypothetical protein MYCGRDRAFT_91921 [Zymoseptoria tritici IPO323]
MWFYLGAFLFKAMHLDEKHVAEMQSAKRVGDVQYAVTKQSRAEERSRRPDRSIEKRRTSKSMWRAVLYKLCGVSVLEEDPLLPLFLKPSTFEQLKERVTKLEYQLQQALDAIATLKDRLYDAQS